MALNNTENPLNLVTVPLDSRGDLFRMDVSEPCALAEVRSLSGHLQVKPAFGEEFFGGCSVM